jgi:hypothetical protein
MVLDVQVSHVRRNNMNTKPQAEARCWDTHPSHAVKAVKRAEAKLTGALRELGNLEAQGQDSAYRYGWALATIESTLAEIKAWGEV